MGNLARLLERLRRLQGEVILPAARTIYLAIACISLAAAVCALLVAVVFEMQSGRSASTVSVPGPYTAQVQPINLDAVRARLLPPQHIAFVVTQGIISSEISSGTVIGYFTAETPNGLAAYPDDISILGGTDAPLFSAVGSNYPGPATRTALGASQDLADQINAALPTLQAVKTRRFSILVAARDVYGNTSTPAMVSFTIAYGLTSAPAEAPAEQLTELQRLARDIALTLDPTRIPPTYYMDLYQRALREPGVCATSDGNDAFVSQYRRAFDRLRATLTPQNISAFYTGVCDAWRQAVTDAQTAELNANAARVSAIAQNAAASAQTELLNFAARAARNVALTVAGLALLAFITISLFLAFLAMENHSQAVRDAVEILARLREREAGDTLP